MIFYLCLIWPFLTATSFINRLPCNMHAKFNKVQNAYIIGNVIQSYANVNYSDCAVACVTNSRCTLVNWKVDSMMCELISDSNPQQIQKNLWIILQPDNTNDKTVGQICEQVNPCDSTQICRDACDSSNKHTFSCLLSNDVSRIAIPTLSSTYSASYVASNANDGDLNTLAAASIPDIGESWFQLDLRYVYNIFQIVFSNRSDGYQNQCVGNKLIVSETNQYLNSLEIGTLTNDSTQTFTGFYTGRYVFIIGKYLSVTELNVFV